MFIIMHFLKCTSVMQVIWASKLGIFMYICLVSMTGAYIRLPQLCLISLYFLKFIIDKHEQILQDGFWRYSKVVNPETYIAALLTNHLLSCLVFGSQYRISVDYRDQPPFCPCKDMTCDRHIVYGQTSVGEFLNIHKFQELI